MLPDSDRASVSTHASVVNTFRQIATALEEDASVVREMLTAVETNKTATIELDKTLRALRSYEDEVPYLTNRVSLGTVAVLLPFNTPLYSLVLYSFGSLLAGNAVRVRPSSISGDALAAIYDRWMAPLLAGLPFRFERGSGEEFVSRAFEDAVEAIVFTGTWEGVSRLRARVSRSTTLIYCGPGVNPFVVFPDADISRAVAAAIYSRTFNSGQDCLATDRFYVHRDVIERFVAELVGEVRGLRVGDLSDHEVDVGPVCVDAIADDVRELLAHPHPARRVVLGGEVRGRIVPPMVITTDNTDALVHAEKFAPVFVIVPFTEAAEAEVLLNDCEYCLGATVFGHAADLTLKAPHVAWDCCLLHVEESDAHVAFGGFGRSGFVQRGERCYGGPLLFSVETSRPTEEA